MYLLYMKRLPEEVLAHLQQFLLLLGQVGIGSTMPSFSAHAALVLSFSIAVSQYVGNRNLNPLPPLMRLLRMLQNGVVLRRCVQSTCSGDTAPCSTRVRRQRRAEPYVRRLPCCACCVRKDFAFDVASFSHRGNRPLSR